MLTFWKLRWVREVLQQHVVRTLRQRKAEKSLRRKRALQHCVEQLETRTMLTMFTVTNTLDNNTSGSLRFAINQANSTPGLDVIAFDGTFSTAKTITLSGTELAITDSVTIQGPGVNLLTLDGNLQSRIFKIDDGAAALQQTVSISGMTLTRGQVAFEDGGAIQSAEDLTLNGVAITASTTQMKGGGIASNTSGNLTIQNSTITGNTAAFGGGSISAVTSYSGQTFIQYSNISNNTTSFGGGGVYIQNSGNALTSIVNSTLSGNTGLCGGGVYLGISGGDAIIQACTISGNTATGGAFAYGGGVYVRQFAGNASLVNSIVAKNTTGGAGADVDVQSGTMAISTSLIGINDRTVLVPAFPTPDLNGNLVGTLSSPVDPKLGALADNGGPTKTMALLAGSPAIAAGSVAGGPNTPTVDQRNKPRPNSGKIDIGAFQIQPLPATPTNLDLLTADDSGTSNSDNITKTQRPHITGQAVAGGTINVVFAKQGGTSTTVTGTVDGTGNWSVQPVSNLADGVYNISATVTVSGVVSLAASGLSITIDTAAPAVPTIILDPATDTGILGDGHTLFRNITVKGTKEANSVLTLKDFTNTLQPIFVDGLGNWSYQTNAAVNVVFSFTAFVTDVAGNVGPPTQTLTITIDPTPAPDGLTLLTDSGTADDRITNDVFPGISGTAFANSIVAVTFAKSGGASSVSNVTADGAGAWTAQPPADLTDGVYDITATANFNGNRSVASTALTITIDTVCNAPTGLTLDPASDTAPANDGKTSDTTPQINGKAEPNSTVTLKEGATVLGTATANSSGDWSITSTALSLGSHTLVADAIDPAGNSSLASTSFPLTIEAPQFPPPTNLTLLAADNSGVTSDTITKNTSPRITGQATAGSSIVVSFAKVGGSTFTGSATADGSGNWTALPVSNLPDGTYTVSATASSGGVTSASSSTLTITIDNTAPAAPTGLALDLASDTGDRDTITTVRAPKIVGSAEPNSTVTLSEGVTVLGTATADGSGAWNFTTSELSLSAHTISVKAADVATNSGPATSFTVTIIAVPAAPTDLRLTQDPNLPRNNTTNNQSPAIFGEGTVGTSILVTFMVHGTNVPVVTADGSFLSGQSRWFANPPSALNQGVYDIFAETVVAGNHSAHSTTLVITIDATAPAAPAALALDATTDTGTVGDGHTSITTPKINGTAEAQSTVTILDGGNVLGTVVADNLGNWSFTTPALSVGTHPITATARDVAGNVSSPSTTFNLEIDAIPVPNAPTNLTLLDDFANPNDRITSFNKPRISGQAPGSSLISVSFVRQGGPTVTLPSFVAASDGSWTAQSASPLPDGVYAITATATVAGVSSAASSPLSITIDQTAPAAPVGLTLDLASDSTPAGDGRTFVTAPQINGSAEANSAVTLKEGNTVLGTTTANGAGAWSITTPTLSLGVHTLTATATDVAGNLSTISAGFALTIEAPPAPTNLVLASDSGASGDNLTNVVRPSISGKATASSIVNVTFTKQGGATVSTTTTATPTGDWAAQPLSDLTDGTYTISATVTAFGNTSALSTALFIFLDTSAAVAPSNLGLLAADNSGSTADRITNVTRPTITGNAEAGGTVTISEGATAYGSATVQANGTWALKLATALSEGPHSLSISAVNKAGNASPVATFSLTIDTIGPAAPTGLGITSDTDTGTAGDGITKNATPIIKGSAEAGNTVTILDGSTVLGTAVATGGSFTFTVPTALAIGTHVITARSAADVAGNSGTTSAPFNLTIINNVTTTVQFAAAQAINRSEASGTVNYTVTRTGDLTIPVTVTVTASNGITGYPFGGTASSADYLLVTPQITFAAGQDTQTVSLNLVNDTDIEARESLVLTLSNPTSDAVLGALSQQQVTIISDDGTDQQKFIQQAFHDTLGRDATSDQMTQLNEAPRQNIAESLVTSVEYRSNLVQRMYQQFLGRAADPQDLNGSVFLLQNGNTDEQVLANILASPEYFTNHFSNNTTFVTGLYNDLFSRAPTPAETEASTNRLDAGTVGGFQVAFELLRTVEYAAIRVQSMFQQYLGRPATPVDTQAFVGLIAQGGTNEVMIAVIIISNEYFTKATSAAGTDTVAPAAPPAPTLDSASDSGISDSDRITNQTSVKINGQAEPLSTVVVRVNGTPAGAAFVDQTGNWTLTNVSLPTEGDNVITATATDGSGNVGPVSAALHVTRDTTAPAAAANLALDPSTDSGSAGDFKTNFQKPKITGTAEPGSIVTVTSDGSPLAQVTAVNDGSWGYTPSAPLVVGTHTLSAQTTDVAGNSGATASKTLTITDEGDAAVNNTFTPPSPYLPPVPDNSTFVVNDLPGVLDTIHTATTLTVNLPITRYFGNVKTLQDNDFMPRNVTLQLPAFDVDSGATTPEIDSITINGHSLNGNSTSNLTGTNGDWSLNTFSIPTEFLNFPADPGVGGVLQPAQNTITIQIDTNKVGWATSIDWVALNIPAPDPVVLVHGETGGPESWDKAWMLRLNFYGVPGTALDLRSAVAGQLGTIAQNAAKIQTQMTALQNRWGFKSVTMVAQGKGGVDARQYVENLTRDFNRNNDALVSQLIMLGTPNGGSPVIDYLNSNVLALAQQAGLPQVIGFANADAARELSTTAMAAYNASHSYNRNTQYFAVAGTYSPDKSDTSLKMLSELIPEDDDLFITAKSASAAFAGPNGHDLTRIRSAGTNGSSAQFNIRRGSDDEFISADFFNRVFDLITSRRGAPTGSTSSAQALNTTIIAGPEVQALDTAEPTDAVASAGTITGVAVLGQDKTEHITLDGGQLAYLTVIYAFGTLDVTLISPSGQIITPAVAETDPNIEYTATGGDFRTAVFALSNPQGGEWTVRIHGTSIEAPFIEPYVLNAFFPTSTLQLQASVDQAGYGVGKPILITADLTNGAAVVTGATVTATVFDPDYNPDSISLFDDGTHGDAQAGDGIYTNQYTGTRTTRTYSVLVKAEGNFPSKFSRQDSLTFAVGQASGQLTSTFTDAAVDTDDNGQFDQLVVHAGINVSSPGYFRVTGDLVDASGQVIDQATFAGNLTATDNQVDLPFDAQRLYLNGLQGPYTLRSIRLSQDTDDLSVPLQQLTPNYQLSDIDFSTLQHPTIFPVMLTTDQGQDTNSNGKFNFLSLNLAINLDVIEDYTWSADLVDSAGTVLDSYTGSGTLAAGLSQVDFNFDGSKIGFNGVDGPYTLSNIVVTGTTVAAAFQERFETQDYSVDQFEGFVGRFPNVPTGLALATSSDTGRLNNDNFTSDDTPTINVKADPGMQVTLLVNQVSITTREVSPGNYSATLATGLVHLGANSVTAVASNTKGTSAPSSSLSIVLAETRTVVIPMGGSQTFTQPGGIPVTVSLSGIATSPVKATVTVLANDQFAEISLITVRSSTAKTPKDKTLALRIQSTAGGVVGAIDIAPALLQSLTLTGVSVGRITAAGSVGTITVTGSGAITGSLSVKTNLTALSAAGMTLGATITVTGSAGLIDVAGAVAGSSITVAKTLSTLNFHGNSNITVRGKKIGILNSQGIMQGTYTVGSIGTLNSTGKLLANLGSTKVSRKNVPPA